METRGPRRDVAVLESVLQNIVRVIEKAQGAPAAGESPSEHQTSLSALRQALSDGETTAFDEGSPAHFLLVLSGVLIRLPDEHPHRAGLLTALPWMVGELVEGNSAVEVNQDAVLGGDMAGTVDAAVKAIRQVLVVTARDDPALPELLGGLGTALTARFALTGKLKDLHLATAANGAALRCQPPGDPFIPYRRLNLAVMWHRLAERTGNERLFNRAVKEFHKVVPTLEADDWRRPLALHKFGVLLVERYERGRDSTDLDQSIRYRREAIESLERLYPDGGDRVSADLRLFRSGLLYALTTRYHRHRDRADLDEALELGQAGVSEDLSVRNVPQEVVSRRALATVLSHAGEEDKNPELLRRGIRILEDLLLVETDITVRRRTASDIALAYVSIHGITGDLEALNEAVARFTTIAHGMIREDPDAAVQFRHLGHALRRRHDAFGDRADLEKAAEAFRTAANVQNGKLESRVVSAYAWGRALATLSAWDRALEGFRTAIGLLSEIAMPRLAPRDRLALMTEVFGLPGAAADCALRTSGPDGAVRAIELLEQARGILAEKSLELPDEGELRMADPMTWRETLARVRTTNPDFHRLPQVQDLLAQAGDRAVVYVVVHEDRAHCIAIHEGRLLVVPLEGVDRDWVVDVTAQVYKGVGIAIGEDPDTPRADGEEIITDALGRIWEAVTRPALDALGYSGAGPGEPLPRLWWIPCGLMSLLPLHAAGVFDPALGHWSDSVHDRVVSSYAVTLRTLLRSQIDGAQIDSTHSNSDMLVIAPDDETLPGVPRERETLKRYVAAGGGLDGMLSDGLSASRVCGLLTRYNIVHFACHGSWDKEDPHRTGFRLGPESDQYLPVRELARLDLPRAELAFLSACNTAMTLTSALQMLDEGLTLATSLHIAGFRNVVGPWWPVNDLMALRMVRTTYAAMEVEADRIDPRSSATALRTSVLTLRSRNPKLPSLWAAHVHIGG